MLELFKSFQDFVLTVRYNFKRLSVFIALCKKTKKKKTWQTSAFPNVPSELNKNKLKHMYRLTITSGLSGSYIVVKRCQRTPSF